jgi:GAF domain-containing protein
MSRPDDPARPVGLDAVLTTGELARRPSRPPDHAAEASALAALAEVLAAKPRGLLQKLADLARELCSADSAGVSILEPGDGNDLFRWHAISGRFAPHLWSTLARDASPCGIVLDRDSPLLFAHPERHFPSPVVIDHPVVETLLVPFHAGGKPVGTVWVIAHTPDRTFDAEDARLLTSLARFASAAHQMVAALDAAEAGRADLERRVKERTEELRASEERLAAELAAMRRLHELVGRLLVCPNLPTALAEVLAATVEITGAEMGNVRLFDAPGNALELVAQRGFGPDFLDRFRVVDTDNTACGRAAREGRRVVIEDVETDSRYGPYREAAGVAGFRAVQSTPLVG